LFISEKSLLSPTQLLAKKGLPLSEFVPWRGGAGQLCPGPGLQLKACHFTVAFCWISSAFTGIARPKATSAWAVTRTQETLSLSGLLSVV